MNFLWNKITEWIKELLISGIMSNLNGLFDGINGQVAEIAGTVGTTPQAWNSSVFNMIKTLSDNVIVPIAGAILTFVMCYELIQMVIDKNSFHDFETFVFMKWVIKTVIGVLLLSHTWDIVMGITMNSPTTTKSWPCWKNGATSSISSTLPFTFSSAS